MLYPPYLGAQNAVQCKKKLTNKHITQRQIKCKYKQMGFKIGFESFQFMTKFGMCCPIMNFTRMHRDKLLYQRLRQ